MNFVTENSGNVTPLIISCGDRSRSSCGNDVTVKKGMLKKTRATIPTVKHATVTVNQWHLCGF